MNRIRNGNGLTSGVVCEFCHSAGSVDRDDAVTTLLEEPTKSALSASNVKGQPTRWRHKFEKAGPVKLPKEMIVVGRPSESGPVAGLVFPRLVEAHRVISCAAQRPR